MKKTLSAYTLATGIWFLSSLFLTIGTCICFLMNGAGGIAFLITVPTGLIAAGLSLPALFIIAWIMPIIRNSHIKHKIITLALGCLCICIPYGMLTGLIDIVDIPFPYLPESLVNTFILWACNLLAIALSNKIFHNYFFTEQEHAISKPQHIFTQINTNMETTNYNPSAAWNNDSNSSKSSNKVVIKAIIIAVLTLAMLIPTTIISNMIIERQTNNTPKAIVAARATTETTVAPTILSRNYEKTMRTTKYAILVIGLTFAVFFLIEIMHKKPVHPMQYTLVGLALAIFYTLLLSIGEYILFDYAYILSGTATIMLITLYVKSHFRNWKAASALGVVLTGLYGFILVLVSLEDTALIVGSIGLFIVLAIVMYTTRNINWYNPSIPKETEALS